MRCSQFADHTVPSLRNSLSHWCSIFLFAWYQHSAMMPFVYWAASLLGVRQLLLWIISRTRCLIKCTLRMRFDIFFNNFCLGNNSGSPFSDITQAASERSNVLRVEEPFSSVYTVYKCRAFTPVKLWHNLIRLFCAQLITSRNQWTDICAFFLHFTKVSDLNRNRTRKVAPVYSKEYNP